MTKYIFVDIDGVLNPDNGLLGDERLVIPENGNVPKFLKERYPISLSTQQGQWLNKLASDTSSTLVWGTSWSKYANGAVGNVIGLPNMDHLHLRREKPPETYGEVKAEAVAKYTKGARFVYFDDKPELAAFIRGLDGMHIYTDPRVGITLSHIKVAEKFLNR